MRYPKGSVMIIPDGDIPLLREVRNSKFVSRRQLFSLLNEATAPLKPSTYAARLERLINREFLRVLPGVLWHSSQVYSIAPLGLMELESRGEFTLALHSGMRHMPHPLACLSRPRVE